MIRAPNALAVPQMGGATPVEYSPLPSLIESESGGNWQAQNNVMGAGDMPGHFGRLQFGQARLQDAMNAGVLPRGTTPQQFMADPQLQMAVEQWHFSDIDRRAAEMGLNQYIGQTVGGATITPDAIRAMAHLGGIGGAARFLETGGEYNPADAYGTSLLDYAMQHGGGGGQRPAGGTGGGQTGGGTYGTTATTGSGNALAMPDVARALQQQQRQQQFNALLEGFNRPIYTNTMRGSVR